jgi:hypothetical protein
MGAAATALLASVLKRSDTRQGRGALPRSGCCSCHPPAHFGNGRQVALGRCRPELSTMTYLDQLHSAPIRSSAPWGSLPPWLFGALPGNAWHAEHRERARYSRGCCLLLRARACILGRRGDSSPDLRSCDRRFLNIKSCNSRTRHGLGRSLGGPQVGGALAARIHVAAVPVWPRKKRSMMGAGACGGEPGRLESWTCTVNEELQMARG